MLDPANEVADPRTPAERLASLASTHPELHQQISAHQNCYPALREWIDTYRAAVSPQSVASEPHMRPLQGTTDGAAPQAAAPKGSRAKKGKFWTRTKVIISGMVAVVGAVTGVISVIPILTRDATNFSHLEIAATPVVGENTEWAIPIEALDADFPTAGSVCGPEQLEWLEAHAEPMQRSFMLNARNSAQEGAMLALTEFRSTTAGDEDRGAVKIRLVCAPSGLLPELSYYAKLMADAPDVQAVHVKVEANAAPNSSPEMPVAFNLAPGESGKIPIDLFSRNPVSGTMQVTVLSRDESQTVEIEGSEFEMPALLFGGEMFLFTTADGLVCNRVESGTLMPCTLDELRHEMEVAPR